ncbi:MAG: right-handed parallel beta-helix repeat-containing protein [Nitrospirae bacterium]|nr:right-handed parallel beta-helix repeat-containing protein [Nitrospirota bacterium]
MLLIRKTKWFALFTNTVVMVLLTVSPSVCATYYVSTTGKDSNTGELTTPWKTIQYAANSAKAGDTVFIRGGSYNEHVVMKHSGVEGSYITFSAYTGESVTIDGKGIAIGSGGGLLDLSNTNYLKVSNLRVINSASAAIYAENTDNIIIANNYTYNSVSSGIGIWSSSNVKIDSNEVVLACNNGNQESITVANTRDFEVVNNAVHDGGPGDKGGEGIDIKSGSHDGIVHDNKVYNINTLCIYVDAGAKHTYNITVYDNTAFNCKTNGFALASEAGGLLENVTLYNNLSYNNTWYGLHIVDYGTNVSNHPLKDINIYNNTFYRNGKEKWAGGIYINNPDVQNLVIRNNIVSNNYMFQIVKTHTVSDSAVVIDNNLIDGFKGYPDETYGTNPVKGDPIFVDPAVFNLRLQSSSPAIDNASTLNVPGHDNDGRRRPKGSGYDIGAYEFTSSNPNPVIMANGVRGIVNISSKDRLIISLSLDSGKYLGSNADWWLVLATSYGVYYYDLNTASWLPGIKPVLQGKLFDIPLGQVFDYTGIAPGTYTFYLGVDTNMNSEVDTNLLFYDSLTVKVVN